MLFRDVPKTIIALVAALLLAGLTSNSRADSIGWSFVGYDDFVAEGQLPDNADGTVNYAVSDKSLTTTLSNLGYSDTAIGNMIKQTDGVFGAPGSYTYFYQVVNTNPLGGNEDPLKGFQLNFSTSAVKSVGYLTTTVFEESAGAVGPTSNPRLDGSLTGFTTDSAAVAPGSGKISSSNVKWFFLDSNFDSTLPADAYSTLLFITSDVGPAMVDGFLQDGGSANGLAPAPVPEPSAVVLLLSCIPAVFWLRRRKARAAR